MKLITDEQHLEIGKMLGCPSCCIEEWVSDRTLNLKWSGKRRGKLYVGPRSREEMKILNEKVSAYLGWHWEGCDYWGYYVPCSQCAMSKEVIPYGWVGLSYD